MKRGGESCDLNRAQYKGAWKGGRADDEVCSL
jgi:hypothetical protein